MAPYAVVNPGSRPKHRRKKGTARRRTASGKFARKAHRKRVVRHVARKATRKRARRSSTKHTYVGALKRVNPRRHYRRRRNPSGFRLPFVGNINFMEIGLTFVGFAGVNYGTGYLVKMLPPEWSMTNGAPDANKINLVRLASKVAITLVPGAMLKRFNSRLGAAWIVGGGLAVLADAVHTYLMPTLGLSAYEAGALAEYEPGSLAEPGGLYAGTTYEGAF